MRFRTLAFFILVAPLASTTWGQVATPPASKPHFSVKNDGTTIAILDGTESIASYIYQHPKVLRPFFAHVKTPTGVQVTRNFPPVDGQDRMDHPAMHPGIWLAFGDINGEDFWRNKAHVRHQGFDQAPNADAGRVTFTQTKAYATGDQQIVCHEVFRCRITRTAAGYLYEFDSTFRPPAGKVAIFGDQEEMGLGIRVANTIAEIGGGAISDSERRRGAKQIWSQSSNWIDYRGVVGDAPAGMAILCHPKNFRPSWMHARDYGLIAANAFGRRAMQKGDISQVEVSTKNPLRLRYGVLVYSGNPSVAGAFEAYAKQTSP